MGATFSTIQIRRPRQTESEQFKKLLCGYFEEKGLIPATEENAEFTYWLAFSDESSWITLGSAEYQLNAVYADVPEIAKKLKTHCIVTSVWDSDFYELKLFGPSIKQRDVIVIGHPPVEEILAEGNRKLWEPLLSEGKTWGEFTEICNGSYTLVEDVLCEIAPLLGMNPKSVTTDYDCCEEGVSGMPNVTNLYFKKAQQPSIKKVASLDTVFKQVFGEALAPLGFVKIKGRQPYFVRLIGDEVVHIITCMNEWSGHPDWKDFNIMGGVATVYRQCMSLEKSPKYNSNWLISNSRLYIQSKSVNSAPQSDDIYDIPFKFSCKEETMLDTVKHSLEVTKRIMLPVLNDVIDLNSCIHYFVKFGPPMFLFDDSEDFGNKNANNYYDEGFLYIRADNYGERYTRFKGEKRRAIDVRDIFVNDPELYEKVLAELERRKAANTEVLRSYGLNLQHF